MSEPESSRPTRRRKQSTREATVPATRRKPRTHAKQRVAVVSGVDPLPDGGNVHEEGAWASVEDDLFHEIQRVHSTDFAKGYRFCGSPKEPVRYYQGLTNQRVKSVIQGTKWHHVCSVAQLKNDQKLVLALIERWWDTTHTFHLPFVELGFTPYDFTCLTGIPIGNGKRLPPYSSAEYKTLKKMQEFFPQMTLADMVDTSGPKCTFLKSILDTLQLPVCNNRSAVPTEEEKMVETMWLRAFFLLVLGEIFFPVSKKWVSSGWFKAVANPYIVESFDWGIPILCQIYSGLDESCRGKAKCAQFFWTVLQYWYYEYIGIPRPLLLEPVDDVYPRILRWAPERWDRALGRVEHDMSAFRRKLEEATFYSVMWQPFASSQAIADAEDCDTALNASHFRFVLTANEICLWYLGDRVWRQLTGVASIPAPPPNPIRVSTADAARWVEEGKIPISGAPLRIDADGVQWQTYWSAVSFGIRLPPRYKDTNTDEVNTAASTDFRLLPGRPRGFEGPGPYHVPDLCDVTQHFADMTFQGPDPSQYVAIPTAAYTMPVHATHADLYRLSQQLGEASMGYRQYLQGRFTAEGYPTYDLHAGAGTDHTYPNTGGAPSSSHQPGDDWAQGYHPTQSLGDDDQYMDRLN